MMMVGFEQTPLFRWSALVGAMEHSGVLSFKVGVIADPSEIGSKIVCARVEGFGMVFRPAEIDRLNRTMKKTKADFPRYARRAMETLQGAANDARYASDAERRKMI